MKREGRWFGKIPVPVDADGNEVSLVTEVMYDRAGYECVINSFSFDMATKHWIAYYKRRGTGDSNKVSNLRLKQPGGPGLSKPDSWERLLGDLDRTEGKAYATCRFACGRMTQCRFCRFHKSPNGDCEGAVLSEVARRIRDLRGED